MSLIFGNQSDFNLDTHSVLTELDRSLHSSSIGDQCEGIVKVPSLFERYPFPILINAASLKLSELFQEGSNFLRILILQVFKESEKHLDKILNIDEFVRHLFAVSYSNDPLARSITLQTLGHIARIVWNNKNIHHFIRNSLESNDEQEVHASIEASVQFAKQSKEFAQNIYPKVIYMIEGLTTPIDIKICLLEVINNLHHNFAIVEDARNKLISFLEKYPEKKFLCQNLHTLTSIASSSITHIPDQVELLLEYYTNDPRISVKLSVLNDLKSLAKESAHLWKPASIDKFINLIFANLDLNNFFYSLNSMELKESRLLCRSLAVLSELVGSPSVFIDNSLVSMDHIAKIVNFGTQIIYQSTLHAMFAENLQISLISKCFTILTNICLHMDSKSIDNIDVLQETCSAYESYFLGKFSTEIDDKTSKEALKEIFKSCVTLCLRQESEPSQVLQITEALRFILLKSKPNSSWYEMICETICALSLVIQKNKSLSSDDIIDMIKSSQKSKKKSFPKNDRLAIKLLIIFFQLKNGSVIMEKESVILLDSLSKYNAWVCYKIVRAAMRYGHHNFATQLLNKIKPSTESIEQCYFWINSLLQITEAEASLINEDLIRLKSDEFLSVNYNCEQLEHGLLKCISTYTQGLTNLKASVSNVKPMQFQCEFVRLRLKYLQAHKHFRQCCQMIQSSPCPISLISNGNQTAQSTNCWSDDLLRNGRIVTSLQKCSQEFRRISDSYSALYQSSFDADPNTLSYIQLCQHSCTLLAEVIENLFQKSHRIDSLFLRSTRTNTISPVDQIRTINSDDSTAASIIEQKEMENVCALISDLVQKNELMSLTNVDQSRRTNGRQFLSLFARQIEMLLRISARMLLVPLSFPRFFFQAIQSTNIKLELSSQQPRNIQDTINIGQSVQFVLYVEGVVITNPSKLKLSTTKMTPMSMSDHRLTMQSMMRMIQKADKQLGGQKRTNIFRKVNKILLTLNAVPINNANDMAHMSPMQSTITMHSIVVPVNDYFHTQFLLSFPNINLYNISVETSIIDENEAQWKSGPIQTITAKVVEDYKAI
ncbi:Integrator complex subunit 7 [Dermatophagoides pteronyssinus]|uniref:Integrator complex subunit 7 n=1 Tax=Dermatophagoides pteronyssinus TaxID=6956 RepID=A0ABQ8JGW6_DERPT|nr:Integrator complex subunit 7 [Dermatophagoides pteronyssinus]